MASSDPTKLKFRVTAREGSSKKWSEKWGVSLAPNEEFHITDQLLKLPFAERQPVTICVFNVPEGELMFRIEDPDRSASMNGLNLREGVMGPGDRLEIAGLILIEVITAPQKKMSAADRDGPTVGNSIADLQTQTGALPDGPTLTNLSMGKGSSKRSIRKDAIEFPPLADAADLPSAPRDLEDPTLTFSASEMESQLVDRLRAPAPVDRKARTFSQPTGAAFGIPLSAKAPESPIELETVTHARRDEGINPDYISDDEPTQLTKTEAYTRHEVALDAAPAQVASPSTRPASAPAFDVQPVTELRSADLTGTIGAGETNTIHREEMTQPGEVLPGNDPSILVKVKSAIRPEAPAPVAPPATPAADPAAQGAKARKIAEFLAAAAPVGSPGGSPAAAAAARPVGSPAVAQPVEPIAPSHPAKPAAPVNRPSGVAKAAQALRAPQPVEVQGATAIAMAIEEPLLSDDAATRFVPAPTAEELRPAAPIEETRTVPSAGEILHAEQISEARAGGFDAVTAYEQNSFISEVNMRGPAPQAESVESATEIPAAPVADETDGPTTLAIPRDALGVGMPASVLSSINVAGSGSSQAREDVVPGDFSGSRLKRRALIFGGAAAATLAVASLAWKTVMNPESTGEIQQAANVMPPPEPIQISPLQTGVSVDELRKKVDEIRKRQLKSE